MMTNDEREQFRRDAAAKNIAYEAKAKEARDRVFGYYADKFGAHFAK